MQIVFCDICQNEVREDDLRYIEFYKAIEDERRLMAQKLEVCSICADTAIKKIRDVKNDTATCHGA